MRIYNIGNIELAEDKKHFRVSYETDKSDMSGNKKVTVNELCNRRKLNYLIDCLYDENNDK